MSNFKSRIEVEYVDFLLTRGSGSGVGPLTLSIDAAATDSVYHFSTHKLKLHTVYPFSQLDLIKIQIPTWK